jgi:hypothetical protein
MGEKPTFAATKEKNDDLIFTSNTSFSTGENNEVNSLNVSNTHN